MSDKKSIVAALPLILLLSACSSAPANNTDTSDNQQTTKGQNISKCLDHSTPDECYRKYGR